MKEKSLSPSDDGKKSETRSKAPRKGKAAAGAEKNTAIKTESKTPSKPKKDAEAESLSYLFRSDMPLADWNIGGTFRWDKLCLGILGTVLVLKTPDAKLPEFSGCPPCLWSLDWFRAESLMAPNRIKAMIETYVKEKVGIFLYFDNPFLTPADMQDSLSNSMINLLAENNPHRLNGVYAASPLLVKHVRANFPGLRIRLAANFHIKEKFRTAQWYNNLAMRYDRVALDPRDGINTDLLAQLRDRKKFEITVNDLALDTCPFRRKHLELLGKIRREPLNVSHLIERQELLQKMEVDTPRVPIASRPLTLTSDEVKALYDQGFRHFRIQAESLSNELTLAHFASKHLMSSAPGTENRKAVLLTTLLIQRDPAGPVLPTGMKNYTIRQYE